MTSLRYILQSGEAKVWGEQARREAKTRQAARKEAAGKVAALLAAHSKEEARLAEVAKEEARQAKEKAEEKLREEALARLREENAGAGAQAQLFEVSLP